MQCDSKNSLVVMQSREQYQKLNDVRHQFLSVDFCGATRQRGPSLCGPR